MISPLDGVHQNNQSKEMDKPFFDFFIFFSRRISSHGCGSGKPCPAPSPLFITIIIDKSMVSVPQQNYTILDLEFVSVRKGSIFTPLSLFFFSFRSLLIAQSDNTCYCRVLHQLGTLPFLQRTGTYCCFCCLQHC